QIVRAQHRFAHRGEHVVLERRQRCEIVGDQRADRVATHGSPCDLLANRLTHVRCRLVKPSAPASYVSTTRSLELGCEGVANRQLARRKRCVVNGNTRHRLRSKLRDAHQLHTRSTPATRAVHQPHSARGSSPRPSRMTAIAAPAMPIAAKMNWWPSRYIRCAGASIFLNLSWSAPAWASRMNLRISAGSAVTVITRSLEVSTRSCDQSPSSPSTKRSR